MEIITNEDNGIISVMIKGRLDADTAPEAEKILENFLTRDHPRLLFDLSDQEYLSSADLRVILRTAQEIQRKSGKFIICSLNNYVKEVFEIIGLQSHLPIAESVDSGYEIFS